MHTKLIYSNIGPRLMVSKPLVSHITAGYLMSLPSHLRVACVYKRLYKLRFMAGDDLVQQNQYQNLIKRKFSQDFNLRRNKVLGSDEHLLEEMMAERLANTYAFIFNATCDTAGPIPEVKFYDDLKVASKPRSETSVLRTMLMMEKEFPPDIKYDPKYTWIESVKSFYSMANQKLLNRDYNKLANLERAHYVGFLQYERAMAQLNESLTLCL